MRPILLIPIILLLSLYIIIHHSGYTLFAAENIMPPDSSFFDEEGYFDAGYKVYIGPGKYFVTSDVGSGRIQWYAFLALPPGMSLSSMHPNSDPPIMMTILTS